MGQVLLPLVTVKTRVDEVIAERLERLADLNHRSVAAELRIAIDAHLAENEEESP